MTLNIHTSIINKLKYFYEMHKIPNIIFNGVSGSGKSKIVNDFISMIYKDNKDMIKDYVMYVNCAHGKGIKFIREELKFFAKTNVNSNGGYTFKSIVLLNGDKLTMDAQSALRRCIELFSHNTRFFIIVEDKYKLLNPILSRFCEIYVPMPLHKDKVINLYKYNLDESFKLTNVKARRMEWLKKELSKWKKQAPLLEDVLIFINKLYEKSYSALDIIKLLEDGFFDLTLLKQYELLVCFNKVRNEIRNEKLILLFIFQFIYFGKTTVLENISFM